MKNTAVKFSLTLVCAAVLAACSFGGGSSALAKDNKANTAKVDVPQAAGE